VNFLNIAEEKNFCFVLWLLAKQLKFDFSSNNHCFQGLEDVKEVHWHPRVPGLVMATSQSGFDVFKTISV
jgi:hypothetical protein